MKTSVIESLQAFILARPPVVAFTLSVVAITIAIFLVAFNIKDKNLILDSHAQEDWNNFVSHMSNQKFCINTSSLQESTRSTVINESQPIPVNRSQNMVFVPVTINQLSVNQRLLMKSQMKEVVAKFDGFFSLKGWKRSCPHHKNSTVDSNKSVSFTLIIPSISLESMVNVLSCVYLSGPSDLFPAVSSTDTATNTVHFEQCRSLNMNVPGGDRGKIFPYDAAGYHPDNSHAACKPDDTIQLSHDSTNLNPKIYLTEDNRMQIFSNLLLAGYISLGVISMLLLTAVLQGRNLILIRQHSLLPTKETMT